MGEWISVKDRLPTSGPEQTDNGPHIHCWCAIDGRFVEHLAWNPYYQCWDQEDEDDISHRNRSVTHWQIMNIPAPPKDFS